MAALVQTIPQQSATVPVLQPRPSSSSGSFPPSSQSIQLQSSRNMSWTSFNPAGGSTSYRGHPVVAPYAFTNAPNLSNPQSWSPRLRPEQRTFSAPSVPQGSPYFAPVGGHSRSANYPAAGSVPSSSNSSAHSYRSKDDTAIPSRQPRHDPLPLRPLSTVNLAPSPSYISSPVSKQSPDRYRRANRRADGVPGGQPSPSRASVSTPAPTVALDDLSLPSRSCNPPIQQDSALNARVRGHNRVSSVGETGNEKPRPELAKRYRRRSWGTMDNAHLINMQLHLPTSPMSMSAGSHDYFDQVPRPRSAQSQRDAVGSNHSAHSSTSSVRSNVDSMSSSSAGPSQPDDSKRTCKPSPLSRPVTMDSPTSPSPPSEEGEPPVLTESIATKHQAETPKNEPKRPRKSRLRRAFSFGSAAELVKASSQSNTNRREAIEAEKTRRELLKEQLGPEQAAIAEQQEASGLGESIYSHHGHLFGSTDELSVSSTASSASIMLRKMGQGVKRSTRSLVGLFRHKSIASMRSADGALAEPMAPQVSAVNVEAEREIVTVNPDPQDLPHGATVFPKVERDSQEANMSIHEGNPADDLQSRKSIVGGDRERAEVLAAVRKGILKKTNSDSAVSLARPDGHNSSDSPHSSVPSTPEDQSRSGNRRNDGVKIAGEDYFLPDGRLQGADATSGTITPQAVVAKSLVFSPRIQFHETWPSGEYDRRGEIATCNRLTPLLAQQIKEELNNFKMEMEVHETSKVYTHFL